jgi:hypothetical protein
MPFSPIIEKIRSIAPGVTAALGGFLGKAKAFLSGLRERLRDKAGMFSAKVPEEYRRPAGIAAAIVAVILLFAALGTLLLSKGETEEKRGDSDPVNVPLVKFFIPVDEVFLPDEPDFVPGVTTERERRAEWTEKEAESWWRDPLENGGQNWRDQIEKNVDDILESVR